ncbi:acetamidase/formamidase family protein [Lederbergia citrea]|uniref:acetamidase/formamidase family protein n=1 Tax=Lederbergia citrea TaxID=2833581 RepID=UPI001BCA47A7|nr:acetamidase/formamidase family protein [Lederbergia citrea]MBS4178246.1 acetamidase/formamidase family protein [Lederbergia citrea]MBS4204923.1 acetamidase/formamidase family protein [Lederbergia citrea]
MSQIVELGKPIYAFSNENTPVATVKSGDRFTVESYDCFEGQITSGDTTMDTINWDRINPATGPIFVESAQPGDVLAVNIHGIQISDSGVIATGKNLGVMGHRMDDDFTVKMIPIEDEEAVFNEKVRIPLNKMIGVIGVAPKNEAVSCGTPGNHGGNLDTVLITEGATIYFPVFHEGALFGLGDMHAAMGDGEIGVSGIEVAGKADITLEVKKGQSINHPLVKNKDGLSILVSAETLDEAAKLAVEEMIDLLLPHTDMDLAEMTMLMSAIGHSQISQIVDPLLTARFFVPQWFLDAYDIKIFN